MGARKVGELKLGDCVHDAQFPERWGTFNGFRNNGRLALVIQPRTGKRWYVPRHRVLLSGRPRAAVS